MKLLGIEITDEEFDFLMCEQNKGKEIKVVDGKVVAVERIVTEKDKLYNYENKVVDLIREKYNINQELAILRQRDVKAEEFAEYNEFVEQCKTRAKQFII